MGGGRLIGSNCYSYYSSIPILQYSRPVRIASLSPAATEILYALGLEDLIVCTDQFSNFPDEVKEKLHLKNHQKIDVSELRKHQPDVILTGTVIQEKLAAELKVQHFGVVHQDPRMIHQIYESIRQLGALFDAQKEAEALVLNMQQGFNDVKRKSSLLGASHGSPLQKPRVYVEEWHLPPMASGNWVPEVIRIAGGQPFPIKDGELSREVSLGEVTRFDPDLIVISWCGAGNLADKKILMEREGWGSLRAVQAGYVRVIDDSLLNRPGPQLVEGAQRIYGWLFEMSSS